MLDLLLAGIWGYILGAIPTGVLIARAMRGVDVRQYGSGHTGGLNVLRVTDFWGGALTAIGDALLGAAAAAGAGLMTGNPWAAVVAGVMAVVGHDWSVFIRFGGGIGLSTLAGAVAYLDFLRALEAVVALLVFWLPLIKLFRVHRARATILVMLVVGPLLRALQMPPPGVPLGILGGIVVIVKTIPDWNRQYN